ncbi:hypothetical protein CRG98_007038 [Punica granatum]|uniref:Uncharacterized protein n=1 Tax=Punica granatum TaxID=22663 RepID=A0A2I0KW22_PUNGR|nr:hypothetical protein CRG98_007038 [Punica granatum]
MKHAASVPSLPIVSIPAQSSLLLDLRMTTLPTHTDTMRITLSSKITPYLLMPHHFSRATCLYVTGSTRRNTKGPKDVRLWIPYSFPPNTSSIKCRPPVLLGLLDTQIFDLKSSLDPQPQVFLGSSTSSLPSISGPPLTSFPSVPLTYSTSDKTLRRSS